MGFFYNAQLAMDENGIMGECVLHMDQCTGPLFNNEAGAKYRLLSYL